MNGEGSSWSMRCDVRSASTGSLTKLQLKCQKHLFFTKSRVCPSLLVSSAAINFRKLSKGVPSPKDKFWPCMILRMIYRRKAGMSLLVVVSLLVLLSFLYISNKDADDLLDDTATHQPRISTKIASTGQNNELNLVQTDKLSSLPLMVNSSFQSPAVSVESSLPSDHPCKQFSVPPPPFDRKRTGPRPCPVCYIPVEKAIDFMPAIPSVTPALKEVTYVTEKEATLPKNGKGGSEFGGYPTLRQRDEYFNIQKSMNVHCGFVKGSKPGNATGFDLNEVDLFEMEKCNGIVVVSAIFGNYDEVQHPINIGEKAKREICFFMFVDDTTVTFLRKSGALGNSLRVGLWRVALVHNLPYSDPRRNGKIPKLLLHRLFPNARFSIWIDGKLKLVVDPYQVLERFLWRSHDTFAISRHYRRFDVFDEAEANKAARKYDNASIDAQIEFYKAEGLIHFSSSKYPITSDVPEGCVVVREHTPITNLFTCLWFNEVDRFTSRDQLSFAIVRDKLMSRINWRVNMFLDCERRNFVVQAYHRDILEQRRSRMPPPQSNNELPKKSLDELPSNSFSKSSRKSVGEKPLEKFSKSSGLNGSTRHVRDKRAPATRHRKLRIRNKGAEIT